MTTTHPNVHLFDLVLGGTPGAWDKVTPGIVPTRIAEIPARRGGVQVHTVHDGELGSWLEGHRSARDFARRTERTINGTLTACGLPDRITITAVPAP